MNCVDLILDAHNGEAERHYECVELLDFRGLKGNKIRVGMQSGLPVLLQDAECALGMDDRILLDVANIVPSCGRNEIDNNALSSKVRDFDR